MTSKKTNADESQRHIWICCFFIPLIIIILTFVFFTSNPDKFLLDNARYFYSAVFQGFAALLALILTAVLITLQNMNSQRYNTEERIYKILGKRFPTYIPGTIKKIKQYIMDKPSFHRDFLACVKENSKISPEKHKSHVKEITNELDSMFAYLDDWEKSKYDLHKFFALSTFFNIVVLFYSAIALILVGPHDVLGVSPCVILFGGLFLVMATIIFFVLYLFKIIKAWTTQPKNS